MPLMYFVVFLGFSYVIVSMSFTRYWLDGEKPSRGFQVWSFANTRDLFFGNLNI